METVPHGIGVQNRYALFYDEDVDPLEILRQQEEEKQKRKTEKTQCKDKAKVTKSNKLPATTPSQKKVVDSAATKTTKSSENTEFASKPKPKGPTDRFQRNIGSNQESKDFEDRKNTRNREDQHFNSEFRERDPEFRRGRGGPRGRGRDRGRGFYGNAENRNRRMFDRHSGSDRTGVRPVDKREGSGPNNWGDIRSEVNQRKEEVMWEEEFEGMGEKARETTWADEEANEKDDVVKNDADNTDTKENEPVQGEPVEEAVKEMTLDEWKREQEAKRVVPKYNLRKPGEGEDDKQWKKSYMLKKKAKEEDDDQDEEDEEDDEEYNRKGNQRLLLDIQINFSDSRRGMRGRGRGGRGAPRAPGRESVGGREERGPRGGRAGNRDTPKSKGQQSAPRVDDFNDFPSLAN